MSWFRRKASEPLPPRRPPRPRVILDPAERELALHHPQETIVMIEDVDVEFARSTLMATGMRVRDALIASLTHEPRDREMHHKLLGHFHACGAAIEKIDAQTPQRVALPRVATLADDMRAAGPPLDQPEPSAAVAAAIEAAVGVQA